MREVELPSGRKLQVTPAPFIPARTLYQAFLEELRGIKIEGQQEIDYNFLKDIICVALSSKKFEAALDECTKRCLIDNLKIDESSFEKIEHREDYLIVIQEVAKENIVPFMKSLYAQFEHIIRDVMFASQK